MTVPAAPTEAGGDKVMFLIYDGGGDNAAALMRAIAAVGLNGDIVGHLAIASHGQDDTHGGAGEPLVLIGGVDGTTIRTLLADSTGRIIVRPLTAYDNGGALAFAHPRAIAQGTVDTEAVAHTAVATHAAGGSFGSTDGVVVLAGIDGSTVRKLIADSAGRLNVATEPAFGGSGFKAIATTNTRVQLGSSLAMRKVRLRAPSSNSAVMYVGGSGVTRDTTEATGGYQLAAGGELEIPVTDRNLVYINGVSGDGVSYLYWT